MKKSILTTIVLTILGFGAYAQSFSTTAQHNVKITAGSVLDVQMTSTADVTFNFTTVANYTDGIEQTNAAQLKVQSNKPWSLAVEALTANFDADVAANDTEVSASKLEVRKSGGTYAALSTTQGTVATGARGANSVSGNTFYVDYQLKPGFIAADNYSLGVRYTVSQP
ncbi:MAG: hypothetical protein LCH67_12700 [Bacteroidetes bacterium]|nr:hypothetical protein [Bacteroidota bacterium]